MYLQYALYTREKILGFHNFPFSCSSFIVWKVSKEFHVINNASVNIFLAFMVLMKKNKREYLFLNNPPPLRTGTRAGRSWSIEEWTTGRQVCTGA